MSIVERRARDLQKYISALQKVYSSLAFGISQIYIDKDMVTW